MGGPKVFRTRTLVRLGGNQAGLVKMLDLTLAMGAKFAELHGFADVAEPKMLEGCDEKLEANRPPGR